MRAYQPADEGPLVDVWNAALVADPIGVATWRRKVLLDANFDSDGCLVATLDGQARGFLLSLVRRVPFFNQGLEPESAWITAFGVQPAYQRRGIGGALLAAALDRLRGLGCKSVTVAAYVPNYFIPGIDVAAYPTAVELLGRAGFECIERPQSMRAELTGFQTPSAVADTAASLLAQGVLVRPAQASDIVPVLDFIRQHFSWDWYREAADVFAELFAGDARQVGLLVAEDAGQIVGYAQHRAERFGPFGVNPALRSRGIGRVLLAATLLEMLKKGYHAAWFLWTSDNAARLYAQCGFHEVRRFAVLKRSLN